MCLDTSLCLQATEQARSVEDQLMLLPDKLSQKLFDFVVGCVCLAAHLKWKFAFI